MSLQDTLDFLTALRENNRKAWFDAHRNDYQVARDAFEGLVAEVIARFETVDAIGPLDPKDAVFRINRDIRFSKDKSPYKTSMSALIGPAGRKSESRYYYVAVEPGNGSVVASGLKSPGSDTLTAIREQISGDATPLRAIIEDETFQRTFGGIMGDRLKTAPRGFAKDHPEIDLLRYKEFMASRSFTDAEVTAANFVDEIITTCQAAKPLTDYFANLLDKPVSSKRGDGKHS